MYEKLFNYNKSLELNCNLESNFYENLLLPYKVTIHLCNKINKPERSNI